MIDLALAKVYIMLTSLEPSMFFIFPENEREQLELHWYNVVQENPILFIRDLSDSQLEKLILWAFGSIFDKINQGSLDEIIRFCQRRKRINKIRQWKVFFRRFFKNQNDYVLLVGQ